jgi:hypothetical protein
MMLCNKSSKFLEYPMPQSPYYTWKSHSYHPHPHLHHQVESTPTSSLLCNPSWSQGSGNKLRHRQTEESHPKSLKTRLPTRPWSIRRCATATRWTPGPSTIAAKSQHVVVVEEVPTEELCQCAMSCREFTEFSSSRLRGSNSFVEEFCSSLTNQLLAN